jgi:hypothetical protein
VVVERYAIEASMVLPLALRRHKSPKSRDVFPGS